MSLRACYAMSGTDSAYGPTVLVEEVQLDGATDDALVCSYALAIHTEIYDVFVCSYVLAMRCPVLTLSMRLRDV
eukprot:1712380-Rhodomonas_salina.3